MGEAKRKREAEKSDLNIDQQRAAADTKQVVAAITDYGGADCFLYAHVGAGLLKSLGLDAKVVAGSAAWRVGDSDGATVCHAREIQCPQNRQPRGLDCVKGGFFHVWIEAPNLIIDFSTDTLKAKVETLDAIDGGKTEIKWAPEFIWYRRSVQDTYDYKMVADPRKVVQSPNAGVCCYIRHADIDVACAVALLARRHSGLLQWCCRPTLRQSGSKISPQFKHLRCPLLAMTTPR